MNVSAQNLSSVVRTVDADYLGKFSEGFAVIAKGTQSGIIDKKGDFLVPYGKYNFHQLKNFDNSTIAEGFVNGYCCVEEVASSKKGFIDQTGKLQIPCDYFTVTSFDKDGYFIGVDKFQQANFVNKQNKKSIIVDEFIYVDYNVKAKSIDVMSDNGGMENLFKAKTPQPTYAPMIHATFSEGLCAGMDREFGYYNRAGKKIIPNQFKFAQPFSEGLAAVAKEDAYGATKWGFINLKGQIIIDFIFSNQPGNFHNGLSVIIPADKSECRYAFIDTKGEILYKILDKTENDFKDFQRDYAWVPNDGRLDLMNKSGRITELKINAASPDRRGHIKRISSFSFNKVIKNNCIIVTVDHKMGIVDTKGEVIIPIIFDDLDTLDPLSGLARATLKTDDRKKIEGYINNQGIFEIVVNNNNNNNKW